MVIVDPKALPSAHQFTVVIDGVETAVHDGVLRRNGGTVAVVGPGVLEVSRLQHVVVRGGGGGGDVRFSRCGYAAAGFSRADDDVSAG
ncbi:unnamed protein product [Miscanthus lutarioriparius]|uniref:Uncharacterized protein n=1 Tax=Miscanthus lutarioriparius TaxID=422564 RepID=A0A811MJC0_9POAL|nr:unnamed protein product [Miscanthus lutarioriparius]